MNKSSVKTPDLRAGAAVHEHRLKNGLRVLIAERHDDPVVTVLLYYHVGSRHEAEHEAGMSHFLEHMMFKGSTNFAKGEVDLSTTLLGGQNNAFTGKDHTGYWMRFASDRWERALDIEADRMTGLTLDPAEFDAERQVVLEELAMGQDDPWSVLAKRTEAALFGRHPYGRPIIGFPESLLGMTPDDMRAYHARFYQPANATLVIAGDVNPKAALRKVRARFGSIPRGPEPRPAYAPALPEPAATRLELSWDDAGRRLCIAWPTVAVGTDADYDLDLAAGLLTGGRGSRLVRRLVEDEGLATSISASNDTRVDGGVFWVFAECAQGTEPAALEAAIDEELARLAEERVPAAELRRVRARIQSSDVAAGETVSDLAEELGGMAVDADWRLAFDGGVRHKKVTAARLRRTVGELLTPDRRVVAWSLPR